MRKILFLILLLLVVSCSEKNELNSNSYSGFPKVFTYPDSVEYPNNHDGYLIAVADGLTGWALCYNGLEPPPRFGEGMVKIQERIGISPLPENLMKISITDD